MSRKPRPTKAVTEPKSQPQPQTMAVELVIAFMADERPVGTATFRLEVPRPAPGAPLRLPVALDVRQLVAGLAPHLRQSAAQAQAVAEAKRAQALAQARSLLVAQKPGLIVPGPNGRIVPPSTN